MAYYMVCPLDLNVRQQHIFTLLYKQSTFKDSFKVAYTIDQLWADSDKCFGLTSKMIQTIIKQLNEKQYVEVIEKGRKGYPTIYRISTENITNSGNELVSNREVIGKQLVINDEPIQTVIDFSGNELVSNREVIGKQLVNPIIKDKETGVKKKKDVYRKIQHLELSFEEFEKLKVIYGEKDVIDVLDSMDNYAKLKKYASAYKTALNWLKKRYPNPTSQKPQVKREYTPEEYADMLRGII